LHTVVARKERTREERQVVRDVLRVDAMHHRRRLRHLLLLQVAWLVASSGANASPSDTTAAAAHWKADPLFPGAGRGTIGVASGVPFVGMGEIAYAPTEHFAIGGIVGATPFVLGLGVRPRIGIPLSDRTRVSLVSPVLYYPTGEGLIGDGPPWFLAQPALRLERRVGELGYVHVAAGIVAAAGVPSKNERGEMVFTYGNRRFVGNDLPWGVWNTVGAGGAFAVFDRTMVFADAMLILRGVTVPSEWIGGPPVAFTLGIARVL
jgi:hypothetical protein